MTAQSKHTPAPWSINQVSPLNKIIESENGSTIAVLQMGIGRLPPEEIEEENANANLIVTAPELLSALEEAVRTLRDDYEVEDHALKDFTDLIKKAKGE